MLRYFVIFIFVNTSLSLFSQGEASHWYFGSGAGLIFDVNTNSVSPTSDASRTIDTNEGCSSISDFNGNLLFYTDGRNIWDKNHQLMPNADYFAGNGLFGDPSSTSSGLIVPRPGNPNNYYVFTVDEPHQNNAWAYPNQGPVDVDGNELSEYEELNGTGGAIPFSDDGFNNGLNYSLVDLTLNNGNGDVVSTQKNKHLLTYDPSDDEQASFKCSEKITAVEHDDKQSYWIISHFLDIFYAFRVDASGVNTTPITTQISPLISLNGYRRNSIGYLKSSPDGKKLAICHNEQGNVQGQNPNNTTGSLWIYDFDDVTGIVSNPINVISNSSVYGTAFSTDSSKLYASAGNIVYQFDLDATDIPGSQTIIHQQSNFIGALQLAPNGKIYIANTATTFALDVINNPDEQGLFCDYDLAGQLLATGTGVNLGLPPFIQSFFLAKIEVDNLCFGNATQFTIDSDESFDSIQWDFGDSSAFTSIINPTHIYENPGNYTVSATLTSGTTIKTFSTTIEIIYLPTVISPVTLSQCDEDGFNDGITIFNLNQIYDKVTNASPNRSLKFYKNRTDAELDASNNFNGDAYTNLENLEKVYVQVTDSQSGCFNVAELILKVSSKTAQNTLLESCDSDGTEDGKFDFTLSDANDDILSGLPPSYTLSYYESYQDALLENNPLGASYTNSTAYNQTIFARIENDNDCFGINQVELIVHELPQIEIEEEVIYCLNTFPGRITLDAGLLSGFPSAFSYQWSTGASTRQIQINKIGTYSVNVTTINGCSKQRTITVLPSNTATIDAIDIVDGVQNNTVTVVVYGEGDYEFALDNENSGYQDSNIFLNVIPGFHTVYVRDKNECGVVKKNIAVIGFPKFFTPNGDGYNDSWHIYGINTPKQIDSQVYVFDRFGKLLVQLDPLGGGWDGTYNGKQMPSSDYWFYVKLVDDRVFKGHFTLKK